MSLIQIIMQVVLVGISVFGISALMEIYKNKIRKGQAQKWENILVASLLSIVAAVGFKLTGLFTPIISYFFPNVTEWIDVAIYAVVIFFLQYNADMKLLKEIVKYATNNLPTGTAILTDEMKRLLEEFKNSTNVDAQTVFAVLNALGFTQEKAEAMLAEIGVEQGKIDAIVSAYKEAAKKEG